MTGVNDRCRTREEQITNSNYTQSIEVSLCRPNVKQYHCYSPSNKQYTRSTNVSLCRPTLNNTHYHTASNKQKTNITPIPSSGRKNTFFAGRANSGSRKFKNEHMLSREHYLILYFSFKFTHGLRENAQFERAH